MMDDDASAAVIHHHTPLILIPCVISPLSTKTTDTLTPTEPPKNFRYDDEDPANYEARVVTRRMVALGEPELVSQ